ncbi:MAG: SpoVA/SpoVAEb family sporulation membrane protein [Treponema sp.]|jgi:stage V sporulation protein AE|nr:SpoVA/SpoVAEb family sporulation membrane protein [Treponema sp.]
MYLNAFLLGGLICLFFQVLASVIKLDPPRLLIFGFVLGAILTPVGISGALAGFGGMGIDSMVLGAGAAVESTAEALISGAAILPFFLVIGVFVALSIIGIIGGKIASGRK